MSIHYDVTVRCDGCGVTLATAQANSSHELFIAPAEWNEKILASGGTVSRHPRRAYVHRCADCAHERTGDSVRAIPVRFGFTRPDWLPPAP